VAVDEQIEGPFEAPAGPPRPPPAYPAYPYGPPGPVPNGYGYGYGPRYGTDSEAIVSLVCGVTGLVFCPYFLGPVALITGIRARTRVRASAGALDGEGLALAGIILGSISIALVVLAILVVVVLVAVGAASS
jgi:hypothetical protein